MPVLILSLGLLGLADAARAATRADAWQIADVSDADVGGVLSYNSNQTATGAVPGDLDLNFNPNVGPSGSTVFSTAVQADGRIVIGGFFATVGKVERTNLARLNADGTLDLNFNPSADSTVYSTAVQADGRIIIGGSFTSVGEVARNNIARLNANGSLDRDFHPDFDGPVYSMAVQADGRILIGGDFYSVGDLTRYHIARLNADGTLDPSFDPDADSTVYSLALQADGRIVIGGDFESVGGIARNHLARLNADGTVDRDFNGFPNRSVYSLALQADGRIVIGGEFASVGSARRNFIARLNADGSVDPAFDPKANGFVYSSTVQADGRIVIGGDFTSVGGVARGYAARLNADGTLDRNFNPSANGIVYGTAPQADGRILVGGNFDAVGGTARGGIALLFNDPATQSLTASTPMRVQWLRGGTAPETTQVSFALSTNGGTAWTPLGPGTRISGGWQLTGLALPTNGTLRARARTASGQFNGSSGLIEQQTILINPAAPVFTLCPAAKTAECASGWSFDTPTAGGGCGRNTISIVSTTINRAGHAGNTFDATRTWRVTDPCGHWAECSQTVTLQDTTPPTILCSAAKMVECGSAWNFDTPTAKDGCGSTTISIMSTAINTAGHLGGTFDATRTWRATDASGNVAECSQTVTVQDTTPPTIVCSPAKTVEVGGAWHFDTPTANDACGSTTISIVSTTINRAGHLGNTFDATRTWRATDTSGNSANCSQTVTVRPTNITVANSNDSGIGSLRAAIDEARPDATITFDPALNGQMILLTGGKLIISKNMTIQGPGSSLLAVSGVFHINPGVTNLIAGLTITNGHAPNLKVGRDNLPVDSLGIYNLGHLTLVESVVTSNAVGIYNYGKFPTSNPSLIVRRSTISGNGEGVYNLADSGDASVEILNSTLAGNTQGIHNFSLGFSIGVPLNLIGHGSVSVKNCTLSGNGIVNNGGDLSIARLSIQNSTLSGSPIVNYNSRYVAFTDMPPVDSSALSIGHTVLANGSTIQFNGGTGTFSFNLTDNSSAGVLGPNVGDLRLAPLADNGGPTRTHALLLGSPAIDAGNPALEAAGTPSDQRGLGFDRIANGRVDVGAYEVQQPKVTQVGITPQGISLKLQGEPNEPLTVEWNSDAKSTGWKQLANGTTDTSGKLGVIDSRPLAMRRFYRAVRK